jgi:hypothetical protein
MTGFDLMKFFMPFFISEGHHDFGGVDECRF